MKVILISFVIVLILSCSSDDSSSKQKSELKPIKLSEQFRIVCGEQLTEDSLSMFTRPSDFEVDNDGNIYIMDGATNSIKKYDKSGSFIRSMGKAGSGPGEISAGFDIVIVGDTLQLRNFATASLVRFDLDGNFIEHTPYQSAQLVFGEIMRGLGDGKIITYINAATPEEGGFSISNDLCLTDSRLNVLHKLREYSVKFDPENVRFFDALTVYTHGDGEIYVAENSNSIYKINVYDFDGKFKRSIKHNYRVVNYNDKEMDRMRSTLNLQMDGEKLEQQKERKKSITSMFYDKYGQLLVASSSERDDKDLNSFYVDVFKDDLFLDRVVIEGVVWDDMISHSYDRVRFIGDKVYKFDHLNGDLVVYNY